MSADDQEPTVPETLTLADVDAVDGATAVGETLRLDLGDAVITARVRQHETGDVECPAEGCLGRFDSERAMKTHVAKSHPDIDLTDYQTCPTCGEEFEGTAEQTYCSRECYWERGRETLVCETCDEEFTAKASHADERRFCSRACRREGGWSVGRDGDEDAGYTHTCPECGDEFHDYVEDRTYCSRDCLSASRHEERTCEMCGRGFEVSKKSDRRYCSRGCSYEFGRIDERPDTRSGVIKRIVAEDHADQSLVERVRAHFPQISRLEARCLVEACRTGNNAHTELVERIASSEAAVEAGVEDLDDVREQLLEALDVLPEWSHLTRESPFEAADEASTMLEFQQEVRKSRAQCRKLVRWLGVLDTIEAGEKTIAYDDERLSDVRAELDIDPSDDQDFEGAHLWERDGTHGGERA